MLSIYYEYMVEQQQKKRGNTHYFTWSRHRNLYFYCSTTAYPKLPQMLVQCGWRLTMFWNAHHLCWYAEDGWWLLTKRHAWYLQPFFQCKLCVLMLCSAYFSSWDTDRKWPLAQHFPQQLNAKPTAMLGAIVRSTFIHSALKNVTFTALLLWAPSFQHH